MILSRKSICSPLFEMSSHSSYGSFEEDELIENWVPVNQGNDGEIYYGDEDVDAVDDEGPVEEVRSQRLG